LRAIALAAVVALVVGGAALGAAALLGGDGEGDRPAPQSPSSGTPAGGAARDGDTQAAIDPATVTVAVLNGTAVDGLAADLGDEVKAEGYRLGTVTNGAEQERAESVVLFVDGARREAEGVARRLNIGQREPIDPENQGIAGDASVVVVVGADRVP
jgi:hypothetical protein